MDKDGNTKEFKTSKVYSIWPQDDELIRDLNQECRKTEGSRKYDDGLFECTKQHGKRAKLFHLHPEFVEKYQMIIRSLDSRLRCVVVVGIPSKVARSQSCLLQMILILGTTDELD